MSRPTVVLTDLTSHITQETYDVFEAAGVEVMDATKINPENPVAVMRDADALFAIFSPISAEVIGQLRRCRVILRCGVGYDNIDADAAAERGIPVCNVPDYGTHEVAEHALSLALALGRRLPMLAQWVKEGNWRPNIAIPAFNEMTFGVIGLGRIGRAAIEKARGFRFRLVACDPYVSESEFARMGVEKRALEELLSEVDILSLHTPLTPETRHLLNAERLALMKPSAVLVNTSRGAVIDTVALADALQNGKIAAAGLDVFESEPLPMEHPLRACQNAILTPHYAWHSIASGPRLFRMGAEEVVRALRGEPLRSCVNADKLRAAPSSQ